MKKFKQTPFFYMIPFFVVFVGLAIAFAIIYPPIMVLLLLSILIQAPIIWVMSTSSYTAQYLDRAKKRKERYELDGDANVWLLEEEEEANSMGYRYWSKTGRIHSALNRARALLALGRKEEAQILLSDIDKNRLDNDEFARYQDMLAYLKGEKTMDQVQQAILGTSQIDAEEPAAASPKAEKKQQPEEQAVVVEEETVVAEEVEPELEPEPEQEQAADEEAGDKRDEPDEDEEGF